MAQHRKCENNHYTKLSEFLSQKDGVFSLNGKGARYALQDTIMTIVRYKLQLNASCSIYWDDYGNLWIHREDFTDFDEIVKGIPFKRTLVITDNEHPETKLLFIYSAVLDSHRVISRGAEPLGTNFRVSVYPDNIYYPLQQKQLFSDVVRVKEVSGLKLTAETFVTNAEEVGFYVKNLYDQKTYRYSCDKEIFEGQVIFSVTVTDSFIAIPFIKTTHEILGEAVYGNVKHRYNDIRPDEIITDWKRQSQWLIIDTAIDWRARLNDYIDQLLCDVPAEAFDEIKNLIISTNLDWVVKVEDYIEQTLLDSPKESTAIIANLVMSTSLSWRITVSDYIHQILNDVDRVSGVIANLIIPTNLDWRIKVESYISDVLIDSPAEAKRIVANLIIDTNLDWRVSIADYIERILLDNPKLAKDLVQNLIISTNLDWRIALHDYVHDILCDNQNIESVKELVNLIVSTNLDWNTHISDLESELSGSGDLSNEARHYLNGVRQVINEASNREELESGIRQVNTILQSRTRALVEQKSGFNSEEVINSVDEIAPIIIEVDHLGNIKNISING